MRSLWLNADDVTRRAPVADGTEADGGTAGTGYTSLIGLHGKIVTASMS